MSASQDSNVTWKTVPTRTVTAGGVEFAYRQLGTKNPGPPLVPRHGAWLPHPSRPEAVPVLHKDGRRDPRRSGATEGTLSEP